MIVGLGIDVVPISRIARMLETYGLRIEQRLFTERERSYSRAKARFAEHFAARFAAKEAAIKALGGPKGLRWHDLEVVSTGGAPRLELHGEAMLVARQLGVQRSHLSLSHAGDTAVAVVILET